MPAREQSGTLIDPLEAVRDDLQAGACSQQTLVLLYNAASEAEQRRDLATLEEARWLAERLVASVDNSLAPAERLLTLCIESTERVRESGSGASATIACPGCGRELRPAPSVAAAAARYSSDRAFSLNWRGHDC